MNIQIRLAKKSDHESVIKIMSQVQDMHVEWRPDIYKHNENLVPQDVGSFKADKNRKESRWHRIAGKC